MTKKELEKEVEKIDKMKGIGETDKKFLKNLLHDKRICKNCKKIRPCEQEEKAKGKFTIMACKEFVDEQR